MRRLGALAFAVAGYASIAFLEPAVAALPAFAAFAAAALALVRAYDAPGA